MADFSHGPFTLVNGEVRTGIAVEPGDVISLSSPASSTIDFGGAVLGVGAPILDANGDDWQTPPDYPAPLCRKNSLIWRIDDGSGVVQWLQGGTDTRLSPGPFRAQTRGEIVLNVNDGHPNDNSRGWQVTVFQSRPEAAPAPNAPRLSVASIELVQVIQRPANSIRLVHNKRTVARVFVDSGTSGVVPGVIGGLSAVDPATGQVLGAGGLINPGGSIEARPSAQIDRSDASHSLNFEIPLSATVGTVRFDVSITTVGHEADPAPGWRAAGSVSAQFHFVPAQEVLPILVEDGRAGIPAPTMTDFGTALEGARIRFPVPEAGFVVNPPIQFRTDYDLNDAWQWRLLLFDLATLMFFFPTTPVGGIRAALIPGGPGRPFGGLGVQWIWPAVPAFISVAPTGPDPSFAQATFAHEMGHAFSLYHANCGDPPPPPPLDSRIPPATEDNGFDVLNRSVVEAGRAELMSYCDRNRRWPSAASYELIRERIPI